MSTLSRAGIGGPKTAAGKARVALNAVKHGLSSTNPVLLEFETVAAWEAFRDAFVADLLPVGAAEAGLAQELASIHWRRRRVPLYEARAANLRIEAIEGALIESAERGVSQARLERNAAEALTEALLPNAVTFDRLLRYEAHLDRKFNHALRHLLRLQQSRRALERESCKTNSSDDQLPHTPAPISGLTPGLPQSETSTPSTIAALPNQPDPAVIQNDKTNSPAEPTTNLADKLSTSAPNPPALAASESRTLPVRKAVPEPAPSRAQSQLWESPHPARPGATAVPPAGYPRAGDVSGLDRVRAGCPPDREGRGNTCGAIQKCVSQCSAPKPASAGFL